MMYLAQKKGFLIKGQNIKNEGILYRDLLILDIENATKNNEKWNPTV